MAKRATKKARIQTLALSAIVVDDKIQPRANDLNQEVVADYQAAIEGKDKLPPLVVFREHGTKYLLAAGFHRLEAHRRTGTETVECEVHIGSRDDALLFAAGSNRRNGHRMSSEDKRRAAANVLQVHPMWSDRKIAKHVGCSDKTVAAVRHPERADKAQTNRPITPSAEFRTPDNRSDLPSHLGCDGAPSLPDGEAEPVLVETDSISQGLGPLPIRADVEKDGHESGAPNNDNPFSVDEPSNSKSTQEIDGGNGRSEAHSPLAPESGANKFLHSAQKQPPQIPTEEQELAHLLHALRSRLERLAERPKWGWLFQLKFDPLVENLQVNKSLKPEPHCGTLRTLVHQLRGEA